MKLGPVTKLDKRNTATSRKLDDDVLSANNDVIVTFQNMANLEQSGSQTSDSWSPDITKTKEVLVLKGIFSEPHMCVYLRTKVQVSSPSSHEFFSISMGLSLQFFQEQLFLHKTADVFMLK